MSSADLSKSEADLLVQQVNALCTDSNTSIISMEEDTPNTKKRPRTLENTGLYPAIIINDGKDTPSTSKKPTTDSGVQTNTERPTKLALDETQLAHFRKLRNIKDKAMRYYPHLEYLEKYKANNIVPKGLKITIEPFLGKNDKDLDKEWNDTTTDASVKLLDITIKKLHNKKDIRELYWIYKLKTLIPFGLNTFS